jgi:Domain of unknown function (DUF1707)
MAAFSPNPGSMLASNADRDRAIDVLRAGFAEGRLTQSEFEERMARVQASRTYDQLAELTCDLPAGPWAGAAMVPGAATGSAIVPGAAMVPGTPVPYRGQAADPTFANLVLTALVIFTLAAVVTALAVAHLHGAAFATYSTPGYSGPPGFSAPGEIHLQPFMQPLHHLHGHP